MRDWGARSDRFGARRGESDGKSESFSRSNVILLEQTVRNTSPGGD
jgi:hypothetical protein